MVRRLLEDLVEPRLERLRLLLDVVVVHRDELDLRQGLVAGRGLDVALVDPLGFGGRLVNIDVLRDCPPPLDGTAGWDLAASLGEVAMEAGVTALFGRADALERTATGWRARVDGDVHEATAVLVATGCRNRPQKKAA